MSGLGLAYKMNRDNSNSSISYSVRNGKIVKFMLIDKKGKKIWENSKEIIQSEENPPQHSMNRKRSSTQVTNDDESKD